MARGFTDKWITDLLWLKSTYEEIDIISVTYYITDESKEMGLNLPSLLCKQNQRYYSDSNMS